MAACTWKKRRDQRTVNITIASISEMRKKCHLLPTDCMFRFDVSWVFKVKNKCSLPVWIVEENLLQDGEGGQLHQGPVKGGQLGATGVSSPAHQVVNSHRHGPGDYHVVEYDTLQGLAQLSWIHLEDKWRGQKRYQKYSNYQASLSTDKCNLHGMTLRSFERHFQTEWGERKTLKTESFSL